MSILVIGQNEEAAIAKAVEVAKANTTPWDAIKDVADLSDSSTLNLNERRNPERIEAIRRKYAPQNVALGTYRCAISFEEQPAGIFRHLSVSSAKPGTIPHEAVLRMVVEAFGFSAFPPLRPYRVWVEEFEPGRHAINMLELEASS